MDKSWYVLIMKAVVSSEEGEPGFRHFGTFGPYDQEKAVKISQELKNRFVFPEPHHVDIIQIVPRTIDEIWSLVTTEDPWLLALPK